MFPSPTARVSRPRFMAARRWATLHPCDCGGYFARETFFQASRLVQYTCNRCGQTILVYGKDPYLSAGKGRRPDIFVSNEGASVKAWHPCAKPINLWMDILRRGSVNEGDLVLDPFLGSGTTAIACLRTGRHYIGIEKHEPYFLKAQERIDKERQQVRLIPCFDFEEATS